ncbi:hypothetical protein GVAV_000857 [Gurleya vavrai]
MYPYWFGPFEVVELGRNGSYCKIRKDKHNEWVYLKNVKRAFFESEEENDVVKEISRKINAINICNFKNAWREKTGTAMKPIRNKLPHTDMNY